MPQRFPTDLTHFVFTVGDIGGLQTLASIPIVAGDSVSVNVEGIWRLSPLRRQLVVDSRVELFGFFVPHRHVYGDDWINFIKAGHNEAVTFTGPTLTANVSYLGCELTTGQNIPLWLPAGYNRIWNRYFRSPTDGNSKADTFVSNDNTELLTGFKCGPVPVPWSGTTIDGVPTTEREVASVANFDIVDLKRVQRQYATEVDRKFFGQRYQDILRQAWGGNANPDADERPYLLAHEKQWLSGYDVDGTGDTSLGTYAGKAAAGCGMNIRRKFFPEHGVLWLMCLTRFPTIHSSERPFLHTVQNPSYLEISGDPELVSAEPPRTYAANEFFRDNTSASLGVGPYGQHYRYHPSIVHRLYETVDGFSFMDQQVDTIDEAHYISNGEYDEVFRTTQLRHWQAQCRVDVNALRVVPPARRSLYAGAT